MRYEAAPGSFTGSLVEDADQGFGSPAATVRPSAPELNGVIRLITCGSVDDGKSTLIGRLLWDASPLYDDQRAKLLKESPSLHGAKRPDFSRLVDGLMAEQEQGITIDIAWHYFDTASRRVVIIDAPGHEQYTRNMATGASHADVAVLLVDAQAGIKRQTRRHLAILDLAGVRRVILAVNKMDLVGWRQARFDDIALDFSGLAKRFPRLDWTAIPVSALGGDNVATRSPEMPWYSGPTFVQYLEAAPTREANAASPFRMPIQTILRDGLGFRGLAGTITAGKVRVGDEVEDALSRRKSTVASIRTMDGDLSSASCGQAVVLQLAGDIDIGRGNVLANPGRPSHASRRFEARLVWLANEGYSKTRGYLVRSATDIAPITALEIDSRLNMDTLELEERGEAEANSILSAHIEVARPLALDLFESHPDTGAFVIVDAITGGAVAGGVVLALKDADAKRSAAAFSLTREMLDRGLCADLPIQGGDEAEFQRRANEVAILFRAAGIAVEIAA